ncbi:hypothetical protein HPF75_1214, partial [Helicobacter pylori]
METKSEPKANE